MSLHAVAPRVVRVRMTAGPLPADKRFSYVIGRPAAGSWSVDVDADRVTLRTAHLVVEASLDPWQLTYRATDGRVLTHEVPDDVNFAGQRLGPRPGFQVESLPNDPARRVLGVVETLLLDPEDHFYGSGERFTRLDLVGRTVRIWNRNPYGARSALAYKNLPLVVGSRGYGIFVDVPTAITFHLGSGSNRSYTVQAAGDELDYYLIAGTPKEIVTAYTELTGRPAVPPEWAFGLWASTCFVAFTDSSVLETARRLRAEGIPCDVFHLDSFWQRAHMWCDFEWDTARIPDPERLLAELHQEGFHTCLWINPYVSLQSALYKEGATHGYFLRRPDGSVYHPVVWSQRTERGMGLCAIVDFTNPAAAAWYRGKLEAQLAIGADSFKPDFAEEIPDDAVFANGLTGALMHNPVLGPERSHVGERAADPLTVEAFVTTAAAFMLRTDAGAVDLRCRRRGPEIAFEASATPATFVLRLHDGPSATTVSADGRALPRLDAASLDRGETGWTVDDRIVVVRARARSIEIR